MIKGVNNEPVSSIITDNYDLIYGTWPKKYNEVVLVLNRENGISALKLFQLGFITEKQYTDAVEKISDGKPAKEIKFDYADICKHTFYLVPACDMYIKNENGTFTKIENYEDYEKELTENKVKLKICGIIRPNEDAENTTISTPVAYTSLLTDYIIDYTNKSKIVKSQKKNPDINVLSGTKFEASDDEEKIKEVTSYIKNLDDTGKANLYRMMLLSGNSDTSSGTSFSMPDIPSVPVIPDISAGGNTPSLTQPGAEDLTVSNSKVPTTASPVVPSTVPSDVPSTAPVTTPSTSPSTTVQPTTQESAQPTTTEQNSQETTQAVTTQPPETTVPTTSPEQAIITGQQQALNQANATIATQGEMLSQAHSALGQQKDALTNAQQVIAGQQSALIQSQTQLQMLTGIISKMQYAFDEMSSMTEETKLAEKMDEWLEEEPDKETLLNIYDQYIGDVSYDYNMSEFGLVDYSAPYAISIYTDSYEDKDAVAACIENYNSSRDEDSKIAYTDYIALITSSLTTIINGISYVLIAFVAISLIVSCIMIGIITHISVMERTKEIGILRALGASKSNISQVFNAETFIIGCCAGILGITISILSLIPINAIIENLTDITDLNAKLPPLAALILIGISIIITILGGLIPSKKAAKKDPVVALRSE